MTMPPALRRGRLFRLFLWVFAAVTAMVVVIVAGIIFLLYWGRFHPTGRTPIVGPVGPRYRAFIDDRSFQDIALIVCASDWPHTFREPYALGDVTFPQAYSSAKIFWSRDGSVLAFRVIHRGESAEVYEAAYDFQNHKPMRYRPDLINALIQARGGLGPQFNEYSEQKGDG